MTRDILLFVNAIRPATFKALRQHAARTGIELTPLVLVDSTIQESLQMRNGQHELPETVTVVSADFDSAASLRESLAPYQDRLYAVTSQYENSIRELQKLIPYLPYMQLPTERSLEWSTNKTPMREVLAAYDRSLVPDFIEVHDASSETIAAIEQAVQYPMIVKPSGLEGSLLVSFVASRKELKTALERTVAGMQPAYDTWIKRQQPSILVEAFMDGDMYSIDTYVDYRGHCIHTPPVKVITGRKVGFEDFFGYMITAPAGLSAKAVHGAEEAAGRACRALGLRALTAHIELMLVDGNWKIIELGPRIGGFRHDIYEHAYGINHIANDVVNRAGDKPHVPRSVKKFAATFDIYAREEGVLQQVDGIDAVRSLPSYVYLKQDLHPGDHVAFAKHNGDPVINLMLSHEDRAQFDQDVAAMERLLQLRVRAS